MKIIDRCSDSDKESAYRNWFYVLTHYEIMKAVNELVEIRNHKPLVSYLITYDTIPLLLAKLADR